MTHGSEDSSRPEAKPSEPIFFDKKALAGTTQSRATEPKDSSSGWRLKSLLPSAPSRGADQCLTASQLDEFRKRACSTKLSEEAQDEISATLGLGQRIRNENVYIEDAAARIGFVFDCLLCDEPQMLLARDERQRLQVDFYSKSGVLSRCLAICSRGSPAALVLVALIVSLCLWTAIVMSIRLLVDSAPTHAFGNVAHAIFFMEGKALAVIASAAFIGGVISIATRLREFSRVRDLDPFAMFWTAMLKPLIGVVLAMFILATLIGGVITFGFFESNAFSNLNEAKNALLLSPRTLYVLWVLGFLAGFSERFAWDFVDRAQGVASGGMSGEKK